jgi:membrane-bound lytic murein transglycosylase D
VWNIARFRWLAFVSFSLLLLLAGCSSIDKPESGHRSLTGTFPVPDEIEDNVAFWRKVYGEWGRGRVAIHDDEHMGVIYEVLDLPGPTHAGYTPEQNQLVKERMAHYQGRLDRLEAEVRAGQSPSGEEKALYTKLVDAGGERAIYGASDRVRAQRGLRERFRRGLEISQRYDAKFRKIFRSKGLPEDLAYLPHVESSFQNHARSSAGAAGMWQFTRGTGKEYLTINNDVDERLDPVAAADGAARYLSDAYRKLGSWPLAVTSYNHGQGGMKRAKAIYGDDIGTIVRSYKGPYFKFASRNYYAEFIAARQIASNPSRFFPEGVAYEAPMSEDRLELHHNIPTDRVASNYGVSTDRLEDSGPHWKGSAREGRADLPSGSTVRLAEGTLGRVAGAPTTPTAMHIAARSEPKWAPVPTKVAVTASGTKPVKIAKVERKTAPKTVKVAVAASKAKTAKVADAGSKSAPKSLKSSKSVKVAKSDSRSKPVKVAAAKVEPRPAKDRKAKASGAVKVHVVQPNETLYRVATHYELSVAELQRLNRMGPNDTNIRPGQRLRVSS